MKETLFWTLISLLNWGAVGNDEIVIEPVVISLSKLNIEEIQSFEDILAQKLYDLDAEKYAKEIGEEAYINNDKYFPTDGFLYSRCAVVANGEEIYSHILNSPKDFPKDIEFEALLTIARKAYEKKTGGVWEYVSKTSYETYSNKSGWKNNQIGRDNVN